MPMIGEASSRSPTCLHPDGYLCLTPAATHRARASVRALCLHPESLVVQCGNSITRIRKLVGWYGSVRHGLGGRGVGQVGGWEGGAGGKEARGGGGGGLFYRLVWWYLGLVGWSSSRLVVVLAPHASPQHPCSSSSSVPSSLCELSRLIGELVSAAPVVVTGHRMLLR